jgi:hypothetical protein
MGRCLTLLNFLRNSVFLLLLAPGAGLAQSTEPPELPPREVKLCDLLRNPSSYDGQRIRVRGEANRDFEDFSLHALGCGSTRRVWLQYGDAQTNAGAEVGHRFIQAAALVKDADYDRFAQKLTPQRLLMPDLKACSGPQCHYYRVTATFSGRFFAGVEPGHDSGSKSFVGFGHADCCHLLVIEKISDVMSERTQVPVGGQFQCATDSWTPNAEQASVMAADPSRVFSTIAKHWGDDASRGTANGSGSWIAPDLLTSYSVDTVVSPDKKNAPDPKTTVTRESCQAVANLGPRPLTEPITCESREWRWQEDRSGAKDLQQSVTMGHDPWRLDLPATSHAAIDEANKQWRLLPANQHLIDSCGNPTFDEGQSAECGWSSPDGMQTFLVRLHKFDYLKKWGGHWEHVIWIATDVEGSFCHGQGEQEKE